MTVIDLTGKWDDEDLFNINMVSVVAPISETNEDMIAVTDITWILDASIRLSLEVDYVKYVFELSTDTNPNDKTVREYPLSDIQNQKTVQQFESREELEAAYEAAVAAKKEELAAARVENITSQMLADINWSL
tara:strand:- start:46 stop:444 length:399 start_codon:yes stop_codon:yes gene_type:complete